MRGLGVPSGRLRRLRAGDRERVALVRHGSDRRPRALKHPQSHSKASGLTRFNHASTSGWNAWGCDPGLGGRIGRNSRRIAPSVSSGASPLTLALAAKCPTWISPHGFPPGLVPGVPFLYETQRPYAITEGSLADRRWNRRLRRARRSRSTFICEMAESSTSEPLRT